MLIITTGITLVTFLVGSQINSLVLLKVTKLVENPTSIDRPIIETTGHVTALPGKISVISDFYASMTDDRSGTYSLREVDH